MNCKTCHPRSQSLGPVRNRRTLLGPLIHQPRLLGDPIAIRTSPLNPIVGRQSTQGTQAQRNENQSKSTFHKTISRGRFTRTEPNRVGPANGRQNRIVTDRQRDCTKQHATGADRPRADRPRADRPRADRPRADRRSTPIDPQLHSGSLGYRKPPSRRRLGSRAWGDGPICDSNALAR